LTAAAEIRISEPKNDCNLSQPLATPDDWQILGAEYNPIQYSDIAATSQSTEINALASRKFQPDRPVRNDNKAPTRKL